MAFACLECCKSFEREFNLSEEYPLTLKCHDCGGQAHNSGGHFNAPKKTDKKQWQKVIFLFEHGFSFQKIRIGSGRHDVVPYPDALEQEKESVEKYKEFAVKQKTAAYKPP